MNRQELRKNLPSDPEPRHSPSAVTVSSDSKSPTTIGDAIERLGNCLKYQSELITRIYDRATPVLRLDTDAAEKSSYPKCPLSRQPAPKHTRFSDRDGRRK